MYAVDDKVETIHLYVVRGQERRPYTVFPLSGAFLCIMAIAAVSLYSAQHPSYQHERLTIPATFLPLKLFEAEVPIIPTGMKTYPATTAYGTLILSNGSILSEVLPSGAIFSGINGVEVQTIQPVFIPAGSASGYGVATVPARAIQTGKAGNIQPLAINAVYGTSLYIRNLTPFTGGRDGYSVAFATIQDKQAALTVARNVLVAQTNNSFHYPCKERYLSSASHIYLTWGCQFANYRVPSYMHVQAVRLVGTNFLVDVTFVPRHHQTGMR